ncbi:MAG TPA: hypothetical protein VER76_11675 [Pyrinomonadaceae bacterium]|nr:hypothetical protein [Pyrinomonadaceae bacterium]
MSDFIKLLVGAVVGFIIAQGSELLRLRREEKRAMGRALKTVMYVREYLLALKLAKDTIKAHANMPAQQIAQFQIFMQVYLLPTAEKLTGKYEEAIDVVSGVRPVLGLRLAKRTELVPMILRYTQLMGVSEQAAEIWLRLESHVSDPSNLDDLILEVAELHSIETRDDVKSFLSKPVEIPPDIEKLLKEKNDPR